MNVKEQLANNIKLMTEGQAASMLLFVDAMQSSFIKRLHGNRSLSSIPEADRKTARRIIDNMYMDNMYAARDVYQAAAAIIDVERESSDPIWNEWIAITSVYMAGREAGIRSERQKKKATDGNQ